MSLFTPGLVSVTFRKLSPAEIIKLVLEAQTPAVEWGADIHVPAGDLTRAREVRRLSDDAGVTCPSYGSYYRLGDGANAEVPFERVLETALLLGAPAIRIWAGRKGSAETGPAARQAILDDAQRIIPLAAAQGVTLGLEYHDNTLTDTRESVRGLMRDLPDPALRFLWQPSNGAPEQECVERLTEVLPRLAHLHLFHWWPTVADRRPLADGEKAWKHYLQLVRAAGKPTACLLEFVLNDSPQQFLEDAATLRRWLSKIETAA